MKITSKDLFAQVKKQHETTLAAAFKSGNPEQMAEAMTDFFDGMNEAVLQKAAEEIDARNQDAAILSARGANVLTADERAYYEGLAAALKASDPRAAVANYEVAMPQTVIERIIGTIKKTHPLLDTPFCCWTFPNWKASSAPLWRLRVLCPPPLPTL